VRAADQVVVLLLALASGLAGASCRCGRTPVSGAADAATASAVALDVGAPCDEAKMGRRGACSADGKTSLACEDGKLALAGVCHGPTGCQMRFADGDAGPLAAYCDISVAIEGQPCGKYEHARLTCDPTRKTQLRCDSLETRWKFDEACKGACVWDGFEGECAK